MALLGTFIDSRTAAGLASLGSTTFAHGVGGAPDLVAIQMNQSSASSRNAAEYVASADATNVSIWNNSGSTGPNFTAVTVRFHSIVR